jgi:hypothetical protein
MSEPIQAVNPARLGSDHPQRWTLWLIFFLRFLAGVSLLKGLYHWSIILGIGDGDGSLFEASTAPWQAATVYFAVIDLVAAVGLWLAAAWGGVLWLTAAISMAAIEYFFPQVYGGSDLVIAGEIGAMVLYLVLAVLSARERPD